MKKAPTTVNPPATPCRITTATGTELWFPDTGLGRALRERLEKEGWERIPRKKELDL